MKTWTIEEIEYLCQNYTDSRDKIAQYLKRSKYSVIKKMSRLGLKMSRGGRNNPNYKNGSIKKDGYIMILKPDYTGTKATGNYIYEHRYIMEQYLGRFLKKDEVVHHKNGIRDDNRISNLELLSSKNHAKLHHAGRYKYNINLVELARLYLIDGYSRNELASMYNINKSIIDYRFKNGKITKTKRATGRKRSRKEINKIISRLQKASRI